MTKRHKTREEPKLNIKDLEKEAGNLYKKQWPTDETVEEDLEIEEVASPGIAGVLDHPSYKELEKKLNEAEERVNEYQNQQLRLQADVDNIQRRAQRDVASARKFALEKFVEALFPVTDSLERAMLSDVHGNEYAKKIHEGIELTMSLFLKALEKFDVKQVDPIGEAFNPELHQAVATQPSDEVAPGTVIEVLQKGYTLNDRLVRPALVMVSVSE